MQRMHVRTVVCVVVGDKECVCVCVCVHEKVECVFVCGRCSGRPGNSRRCQSSQAQERIRRCQRPGGQAANEYRDAVLDSMDVAGVSRCIVYGDGVLSYI